MNDPVPLPAAAGMPDPLRQLTLLYVEDEPAIRDEVAYFLERRVGRLVTAANGEEG